MPRMPRTKLLFLRAIRDVTFRLGEDGKLHCQWPIRSDCRMSLDWRGWKQALDEFDSAQKGVPIGKLGAILAGFGQFPIKTFMTMKEFVGPEHAIWFDTE